MSLAGNASRKILIVEDDQDLVELLTVHLEAEGYELTLAVNGEAALRAFPEDTWALVILDWMLPTVSGIDVLREIRIQDSRTPVLMLTARGEEADKVLGLELGCDDYLTKPFSFRELAARIKVLRRRIERAEEMARIEAGDSILDLGPLKIDHAKRKVSKRGQNISLTVKEYDLLYTLAVRPGRTFSRRQLLDLVWDESSDVYEHTVNSHINRLRSKVEDQPNRPALILTVWGIGYRFADDY